MKKKQKPEVIKEEEKPVEQPKKGITIAETEDDVVLGGSIGDPEDFKNEVKKEAEKGRVVRTLIPIFVFLLLGAVVAYGTMYYKNQSDNEPTKNAEDKIQTPPDVNDGTDDSTIDDATGTTGTTTNTTTTPTTATNTGYTNYTVKSGDTLSGIANAHDMTSAELAKYNNISVNTVLHIGQTIKIPNS